MIALVDEDDDVEVEAGVEFEDDTGKRPRLDEIIRSLLEVILLLSGDESMAWM